MPFMSFAELWGLADRNGLFGLPWAFKVELQNTRVGNSFSWDFYKCLQYAFHNATPAQFKQINSMTFAEK